MSKTLVGAIRWDAWVGERNPLALTFAKNLSSFEYHHRLPFFAEMIDEVNAKVDGVRQDIYDKEIEYARNAGIDYFAVCWYPDGSGLEYQRKLYFTSQKRFDVKWCIIHGTHPFDNEKDMAWLIEEMKQSTYQKVMDERPLVYMFTLDEGQRPFIEKLRSDCTKAGLNQPYIVGMGFSKDISIPAKALGVDAISAYCCYAECGCDYETQMKFEMNRWEEYRKTGMDVVPFVTTGFDNRPRFQGNGDNGIQGEYNCAYIQEATPEQTARHLSNAIQWCNRYPDTAKANTVIMYAWNENDEGGYLIPTKKEIEELGYSPKLEAISKVERQ